MFALTLSQDNKVAIAIAVATLLFGGPVMAALLTAISGRTAKAKWRWHTRPTIDRSNYVVARLEKWGTKRSELWNATLVERVGFWGKVLQWTFGPRRDGHRVWYSWGLWVLKVGDSGKPYLQWQKKPVHDLHRAFEDAAGLELEGTMVENAYLPERLRFWRWQNRPPRAFRLRVVVTTSHGTLRKRPRVSPNRSVPIGHPAPPAEGDASTS